MPVPRRRRPSGVIFALAACVVFVLTAAGLPRVNAQDVVTLCDSEIAQRDELLRRITGARTPIGPARNQEIARVYQAYRFE